MIVGLGNPGKKFEKTRHNIGFEIIDKLANHLKIKVSEKENEEVVFVGNYLEKKFMLVKPQKFMNNSGETVSYLSEHFKIHTNKIIVIHDDISLPIGKIRLKRNGSSGGHNGIKSIILHLKNEEFKRLKIGIGYNKEFKLEDWVIGKFTQEELKKLNEVNQKILEFLLMWIAE